MDPAMSSLEPMAVGPTPTGLSGAAGRALALIDAGGPIVVILLAMSVVALAIVFLKLWQFRAVRIGERKPIREAIALHRGGRVEEALAVLRPSRNPIARVLERAIRGRMREDLPESKVREEAVRVGSDQIEALRGLFRPLEVIASLAPLLGLFGTVLGMIDAFRNMERAGARVDPAILSGGIWEALLTTAVGLAVAIPVVAVLNWLERVVDRLSHDMESAVTQIFTEDLLVSPEVSRGPIRLRAQPAE